MAASKTIGGINVTISATIDKFQRGMKTAQRALKSFASATKRALFNFKTFGAALAGGIAVGGLVKMTKNAFTAIDAMKDLSDKLGVNIDKLKGLEIAADEAGISTTVLERALTVLSSKTGVAGDVALRMWIERTAQLTTHQERLSAAIEMFGMRGASMVRMVEGGASALDDAQKAAEGMGWAISSQAAAGVDRALEAFERMKMAVSGIFASVAVEIAPLLEVLSSKLSNFLAEGGRARNAGKSIADVVIAAVGMIGDKIQEMIRGIAALIKEARAAIAAARNIPAKAVSRLSQPGFGLFNSGPFSLSGGGLRGGGGAGAAAGGATGGAKFSTWLNRQVDSARSAISTVKPIEQGVAASLRRVLASAGASIVSDIKNLPQTFGGPAFQAALRTMGFSIQQQLAGAGSYQAKHRALGVNPGSLSAVDPLSREGFAQRVRSQRQNDVAKIAQQQLDQQKAMRRGIDKIASAPPLQPANL